MICLDDRDSQKSIECSSDWDSAGMEWVRANNKNIRFFYREAFRIQVNKNMINVSGWMNVDFAVIANLCKVRLNDATDDRQWDERMNKQSGRNPISAIRDTPTRK